jgi:hypothetical protein
MIIITKNMILLMNCILFDIFFRTKHGFEFYSCIKRNTSSRHHFNACLETLTDHCTNSQIRSTKTIRMTLQMADKILTLLPDLKIIYLVRDPRAVIQSRISLNLVDDQNVAEESSQLCDRMEKDAELIEKSRNKNRIQIVQYEHFAKNTVSIAKDIFKFLDYELYSLWFNPTRIRTHGESANTNYIVLCSTLQVSEVRTHDLPHLRRAC